MRLRESKSESEIKIYLIQTVHASIIIYQYIIVCYKILLYTEKIMETPTKTY